MTVARMPNARFVTAHLQNQSRISAQNACGARVQRSLVVLGTLQYSTSVRPVVDAVDLDSLAWTFMPDPPSSVRHRSLVRCVLALNAGGCQAHARSGQACEGWRDGFFSFGAAACPPAPALAPARRPTVPRRAGGSLVANEFLQEAWLATVSLFLPSRSEARSHAGC